MAEGFKPYSTMTDEQAIELAKRSIAPCKGVTKAALERVLAMAEAYLASVRGK